MPSKKEEVVSIFICNGKAEEAESWQKFHGHAIVVRERLQEKINESVTCRFCQGSVELGSTWMFQCPEESCPLHETNLALLMTEKSGAFVINRASVFFGFGVIDGGHATTSRFLHVVFSVCIHGMTILDNSDMYLTRKYNVFPPRPA